MIEWFNMQVFKYIKKKLKKKIYVVVSYCQTLFSSKAFLLKLKKIKCILEIDVKPT